MQLGEIIAVGKRPVVSTPYVIVGVDSIPGECESSESSLWCLAVLSTERVFFTPFNPVYCPSASITVDCSYICRVTLDEVDKTIGRIHDDELHNLIHEVQVFHDHQQSINVVSLLMFVQNNILPFLISEFSANTHQSSGVAMAIDRIEQMNELFDFFVGIAELNPRQALQNLAQRDLPLPPANSDFKKLRKFYSTRNASFVASELAEELLLYCQCKWIRTEAQAPADLARLRLIELFELTRDSSSELSTMLLRLPAPIRKEICFFERDRRE